MNDLIDPKKCKHEHIRKSGIYITYGRKTQKYQCVDCGKIILNKKEPAIPGKENMQAKNQPSAKTGDSNGI